jgi:hypothetical protein
MRKRILIRLVLAALSLVVLCAYSWSYRDPPFFCISKVSNIPGYIQPSQETFDSVKGHALFSFLTARAD